MREKLLKIILVVGMTQAMIAFLAVLAFFVISCFIYNFYALFSDAFK